MIIECPACTSRYRIREDKLPAAGGNIKCPNCAHIFFVARDGNTSESKGHRVVEDVDAPPPVAQVDAPPAPLPDPFSDSDVPAEETGEARKQRWKLKNPVGLVYDFPDTEQIRKWLAGRDSFEGFSVSSDGGATWMAVVDAAELADVRPTGRKTMAVQAVGIAPRPSPGHSGGHASVPPPANMSGSHSSVADRLRQDAEERLRTSRATRRPAVVVEPEQKEFRYIKPPASRQEVQASRLLLLLALAILPLLAVVALHIVGVIDLREWGLLPGRTTPVAVVAATDEEAEQGEAVNTGPELTPEQAVNALINQAAAAQSRGEHDDAVDFLERAREILPEDRQLQCLLAPLYLDLQRVADAAAATRACEGDEAADAVPEGEPQPDSPTQAPE